MKTQVVDLFCGVGGLTRGLLDSGLNVVGGFDLDQTCQYTYEKNNEVKFKILGNGSNVLFSDKTYDGVLIRLNEFDKVDFLPRNKIIVGAGYSLMKLSLQASKKGLAGLEFAAGIPGTVGGAIYMNAGAYKSDMGYIVQQVKVLTPDLKVITLSNKEMNFHYRSSFLQSHPGYICLEVVLKLTKGDILRKSI